MNTVLPFLGRIKLGFMRLGVCSMLLVCGFNVVCSQTAAIIDDAYYPQPKNSYNVKTLIIDGSSGTITALRFDIASVIPTGTPGNHISKATLKLFVTAINGGGTFSVYRITSAWSENGSSAPLFDLNPVVANINGTRPNSYLTVDVTSIVQQWLGTDGQGTGGVPNFGIVLASAGVSSFTFDSKEASLTSHNAELDIVLNHSATADSSAVADTVTGPVNASLITGNLTNANIDGSQVSGAVTQANLADTVPDNSITSAKIAALQVVKSVNGLKDNITLTAGANVTLTSSGNSLTIAANKDVVHDSTLTGTGTTASPLRTAVPMVIRGDSLFVGAAAGNGQNTTGQLNSFFGFSAGLNTTSGESNSFFGGEAGRFNTTGNGNVFFGTGAGKFNTTGGANTFVGSGSGVSNTIAFGNSFFGSNAGLVSTGLNNSFFGAGTGTFNKTGDLNSYFGAHAGGVNETGVANTAIGFVAGNGLNGESFNTFVGYDTEVGTSGISHATAIGAEAVVSQSNSIVLGRTIDSVGIGTAAPRSKLHVEGGNVLVSLPGAGILLKSPDGSICRLLSIDNSGNLVLTPQACP